MFYVYRFRNTINSKVYIGKTGDPYRRFMEHKRGSGNAVYLTNAICKYGISNFEFSVIDECVFEMDCLDMEKAYIKHFRSNERAYGYNLTDGGEGISGWKHSEETKRKMSETRKGELSPNFGKTIPDWHKEILSKTHKGKKLSEAHINIMKSLSGKNSPLFGKPKTPEHIANMKEASPKGEDHYLFGKKVSDAIRANMSAGQMGRKRSPETAKKLNGENHWAFGRKGKDNPLFGRKFPETSKRLKGERNPMAKLTEKDVRKIKQLISDGLRNRDIQKIMNLSSEIVSKIRTGARWSHIKIDSDKDQE